jgi:predicted dehydrogenase
MKIAGLGCGSIGRRHLRNLHAAGWTHLFAFDPVPEAHRVLAEELDIPASDNLNDVWRFAPDVVFISSPSNLHVEQALMAARRGCHLFVEKPLSHSLDGVDDLLAASDGLVTMIGCNMRFHPGPAQIKRWLDAGLAGKVLAARLHAGSYLPRWRPHQDYIESYSASPLWGGAVLDIIHEIDLALWLLGQATLYTALIRPASSIGLETDGLAELLLEHEGGVVSSVHLNFVQRNYHRSIEVIGSEGTLYWDFADGRMLHYGPDGEVAQVTRHPDGWEFNQVYVDEIEYFMGCVERGESTFNPIENAAETLKIALKARTYRRDR